MYKGWYKNGEEIRFYFGVYEVSDSIVYLYQDKKDFINKVPTIKQDELSSSWLKSSEYLGQIIEEVAQ